MESVGRRHISGREGPYWWYVDACIFPPKATLTVVGRSQILDRDRIETVVKAGIPNQIDECYQRNLEPSSKMTRAELLERVQTNMKPQTES
ncbi:uncharacterized protein Z518_10273 [Rhinocladiella mackenziei CBS 650.93]|uniref:Uncharacterized protein n=1 Tax=Rhinocladiella mackenziei CBS 650.93 TaxID=1442369 RepID=A0A0D2IA63_9EURO|nr:uncharacterized protein Z518_10273 [Rhinocladiella mackenziei CBS 650.93]KIX00136.1 hypothetical protein Z518_10273 [Rhinocladiella mackenziei CBS 650.93]